MDLLYLRYLHVYIKGSRAELYFTELFWTNTNFCVHAVSIPPLIFVRVNCMGMAAYCWIGDFIEMNETPYASSSVFFVTQYLPAHEMSFILLADFYVKR